MSREIVGCPNYWDVDRAFLSSKKKPRILFNVLVCTWKALSPAPNSHLPSVLETILQGGKNRLRSGSEQEVMGALRTPGPGVSRRFTLVVTRHLLLVVKYQPEDLH